MRVKLDAEFLKTEILTNGEIRDKKNWRVQDLLILTGRMWIVYKKQRGVG